MQFYVICSNLDNFSSIIIGPTVRMPFGSFLVKSIRTRLLTHFIFLGVVPLLCVGGVMLMLTFSVQKQQAVDLQTEIAIQVGSRVQEYMQTLERVLRLGVSLAEIQKLSPEDQKRVLFYLVKYGNAPFEYLAMTDDQGKLTACVGQKNNAPQCRPEVWEDSAIVRSVRETARTLLARVQPGNSPDSTLNLIALPLDSDGNGTTDAVLLAGARLKPIWDLLTGLDLGKEETVYILDNDNRIIAHNSSQKIADNTTVRIPNAPGLDTGLFGTPVIKSFHRVKLGDQYFTVVAEQARNKALGLAYSTFETVAVLFFASLLSAAALAFFSIRRIVTPISNLARTVRAVRAGDLSRRAKIERSDEIGVLAESFNEMTSQLEITLQGLHENIKELTDTQKKLQKSERKFRGIYEQASEGILLIDESGLIRGANPQALLSLEFDYDELIGMQTAAIFHAEDLKKLPIEQALRKVHAGETLRLERRLRRKDGVYLTTAVGIREMDDERILFMFRDISKRKRMEQELLRAKTTAEEANKAKGQFLANMSHEIRTPLSCIIGMAELSQESELDPDTRENVETILDSALSLLDIINDILDFTKIEAKGLDLVAHDFNIRKCMDKTIRSFRPQADRKGLVVECEIDDSVPRMLHGDSGRLTQVVRNLISNSIKFTHKGSIRVTATLPSPSNLPLKLMFKVEDTGIGVPEDKLNKLFFSFSQVDSSYSKKYPGTGLGLAISKKLVEMMGGSIWVESTEKKGSTFYFTCLLDPVQSKKTTTAPQIDPFSALPEAPRSLKILFAEDNAINRHFISGFLKDAGHNVTPVTNGLEVLKALEKQKFDIILMDVQMPEMDGVTATVKVREGNSGINSTHIPILALTAYAMREDKKRFVSAGMNGCVTKPIDRELLFSTIYQLTSTDPDA